MLSWRGLSQEEWRDRPSSDSRSLSRFEQEHKRFLEGKRINEVLLVAQAPGVPQAIVPAQINATSTFGGSVAALKQVVPAQINAVATVSGSVAALRPIVPAQINAVSTVSGAVTALRPVVPAQINAVSTVSGSVVALRPIVPAQINAVSVVSGTVTALHLIIPAQINAVAIVSGTVTALHFVIPAQINAIATVSGTVTIPTVGVLSLGLPGQNWRGLSREEWRDVATRTGRLSSPQQVRKRAIRYKDIKEIQFVAQSYGAPALLAPAQINAVSTFGGTVTALRAVIPAQINAVATISGTIVGPISTTIGLPDQYWRGLSQESWVDAATGSDGLSNPLQIRKRFIRYRDIREIPFVGPPPAAGLKPLAPAQINALSTVGGTVTALKSIVPAINAISAISVVSGSIVAARRIAPAQINAISTVSGKVVVGRAILPAQINATSTVSGTVTRRGAKFISLGIIFATATVSGNVAVRRFLFPAQINAISSVSLSTFGAVKLLIFPVGSDDVSWAHLGGDPFDNTTLTSVIPDIL